MQVSESSIKGVGESLLVSSDFTNLSVVYVSERGHTVLYRAQRLGKTFLLKGLNTGLESNPVYRGLLMKEFEIAYKMSHPNIVETVGMESVEGVGFLYRT